METIIQLRVGTKLFPVDRKKLCAESKYFDVMLQSGRFTESNRQVIELKEVDEDHFARFMEWLEKGEEYITNLNINPLLLMADRFMVESLETQCHSVLCEEKEKIDMLEILETSLFVNDTMLESIAVDYIKEKLATHVSGENTNFVMKNDEKIKGMSAEAQRIILSLLVDNEKPRFAEETRRNNELLDFRNTQIELAQLRSEHFFVQDKATMVEKQFNEFKIYQSKVKDMNENYVLRVLDILKSHHAIQIAKLKDEISQLKATRAGPNMTEAKVEEDKKAPEEHLKSSTFRILEVSEKIDESQKLYC